MGVAMKRFGATLASCLVFCFCLCVSLCVPAPASARTPLFLAVSPSAWMPVNAVWQGANVYGTGKPVSVYFIHSIADWGNQLYFMDPATGSENPLLLYRGSGRGGACPDSGGLVADLGVRDSSQQLVFMLRTISSNYAGKYCTGEACGPRYTGMNDASARFHSSGEYAHLLGQVWAQAARIPQAKADSMGPPCTGTSRIPPGEGGVLFSFNDGANDSFEDLVILVTGVEMDVERDHVIPPDSAKPKPKPIPVNCVLDATTGGVTHGDAFLPRPMEMPLSAIRPRDMPTQARYHLDQAWRERYPGRPDETAFPNGPEITVTSALPFSFNLGFFTNTGEFINRAHGSVTAGMMGLLPVAGDGRRAVSLMWYPVSEKGNLVSTGAYVVKGWIRSNPASEAVGPAAACPEEKTNLLSAFGYIRH